jgi:hypothetical protein
MATVQRSGKSRGANSSPHDTATPNPTSKRLSRSRRIIHSNYKEYVILFIGYTILDGYCKICGGKL